MEITTERLILREFQYEDWPDILAYQSDPLYLRYYDWTDRTPESVQNFVRGFLAQQKEQPRIKFQLAVALRSNGQLIGNCGIRLNSVNAVEGDLGFELSSKHWGCGYATEAARAMAAFGFTELNLHRIWSRCIAENVGSAHVLKKLGMRQEGRLRQNEYFKGRWWDTLLYGMLENEWQTQQSVANTGAAEGAAD
jgi:ribosomal-protein-alanine N-acetyltransferase